MSTDTSKPGYADALAELDAILRELETSDVDVDRLAERVARASELIALCRDRAIGAIAVGMPFELSGAIGPRAKRVQVFIDALRAALPPAIAIHEIDERFTTAEAERVLIAGDVSRVDVRVSGSGDTRVSGTAPALGVTLDGSGTVDARGLDATTADLALSGSGDIAASVSGSARVSLSGSGDVDLYGNAALERVEISGSGSVRQH